MALSKSQPTQDGELSASCHKQQHYWVFTQRSRGVVRGDPLREKARGERLPWRVSVCVSPNIAIRDKNSLFIRDGKARELVFIYTEKGVEGII